MRFTSIRPRLWLFALAIFAFSGLAAAEPPSRAARLSYISGNVSFSPAGESGWVRAVVNRPLTSGDRLWVDAGSRAELQVGGAAIRLGAATSLVLLNLDDSIVQMELDQGTLNVRVRRMGPTQAFEVDTPNLAFSMRGPGNYRVDADPGADATTVRAHSGRAEVYGDRASYAVMAGQGYRFYATGLADYERLATSRDDEFDRWARERDRRIEAARSARYVSPDVVGYEELDAYGTWGNDPDYGYVWQPSRVASGWTPYRDGHWAWIDPWGWTWVDDAPWGYAVSHYGRWANRRGTWVWVPGPQRAQAVYAPALVSFVDGRNLAAATAIGAAIAWFALAPREVYRPSYPVSRSYFDRINRSNTVVAPATVTNIYNIHQAARPGAAPARTTYANQRVPGAVVAVPAQAFAQSQPVARAALPVSREAAATAPVAAVAAVAPVQQSVHGGAPAASASPPAPRERRVVTRAAPPPPPAAFAAQQSQLAARPGVPIDEGQRRQLKPAAAATGAVTAAQAPAPTAAPPATPPGGRQTRRGDAGRGDAARMDAPKPDATKADAAKADAAKADAAKADAARADAMKAEAARAADAAKAAATKGDAARAEAAKAEAGRVEALRKADADKAEAAKAAAARTDAARAESAKADAGRAEAAKGAAARDAARAEAARAEAAKGAAAKADAARGEAAKADAARAEAAKGAAAKAEAAKAEAAKAEAARAEAAKAAAAKAEAAKAAAKSEPAKAEAAKADAAKAEAAKGEAGKGRRGRGDRADDEKKGP